MQAVWEAYIVAMRKAEFDKNTSLYVASGLLSYGDKKGVHRLWSWCMLSQTKVYNQDRGNTERAAVHALYSVHLSNLDLYVDFLTGMQQAQAFLMTMGFSSTVHTKEMHLQAAVIEGDCSILSQPQMHASQDNPRRLICHLGASFL